MATKRAAKKSTKARQSAEAKSAKSPWERGNPKREGEHKQLSPQAKATAKRRAKAAGRPYPNLVDNMHAATEKK